MHHRQHAAAASEPLLRPGDRLPPLTLEATGGRSIHLRAPSRDASVLVFPHSAECEDCRAYLRALSDEADELRQWYGRILAVLPPCPAAESAASNGEARDRSLAFPVLMDTSGEARERCGVAPGEAAILIADRYGEVYEATGAGAEHAFPSVRDVESWLRFLATQCPECGVIDEPGFGEWAP